MPKVERVRYHYSPHLPPELRFDPSGEADKLPELIAEAGKRPLTPDEQMLLANALRNHEPWLELAGKREQHERVTSRLIESDHAHNLEWSGVCWNDPTLAGNGVSGKALFPAVTLS